MKKWFSRACSLLLSLSLLSCSSTAEKKGMYIETAALTEEEESVAKLLGLGNDRYLYDFTLDNSVKSMKVTLYEWTDNEWKPFSNGYQIFSDQSGRFALIFDKISDGIQVSVQSEHHIYTESISIDPQPLLSDQSDCITNMDDYTLITYDQEIPLFVQILNWPNPFPSGTEMFYYPDMLQEYKDAHMYAITICFSQKTSSELEA